MLSSACNLSSRLLGELQKRLQLSMQITRSKSRAASSRAPYPADKRQEYPTIAMPRMLRFATSVAE